MSYDNIVVETRDRVGLIRLNRPQRMNALNDALAAELSQALAAFDADSGIGAIVITGNDKAFAAGADIGAMAEWDYQKVYADNYITRDWEDVRKQAKPVIAAVAGYALGGGCELAMMCDLIVAADTAKFGQPEITIGTMPGLGGTQRLPRAVGKAKAMDWCLTGRMIDAAEAERSGLVARVVPADKLEEEAIAVAAKIASFSLPVVLKIKEAINRAYESSLAEGPALRAARISLDVRARRPEGRHARVRRKAQARRSSIAERAIAPMQLSSARWPCPSLVPHTLHASRIACAICVLPSRPATMRLPRVLRVDRRCKARGRIRASPAARSRKFFVIGLARAT